MATWRNRNWRSNLLGVFCIIGAIAYVIFCSENHALAQIIPDETLDDNSSKITPNVNIKRLPADRINGGTIRGTNLFHSFQDFNVGELQRVYFANPTGIENILARVTGSNVSNILGTLGVDGAANLFLLNPNGIVFGKNARLDVAGSFMASTANAIQFGNQGLFSATNPETPSPLLTVNPSALFVNQLQPGKIETLSSLRVPNGRSLLLVGGDIAVKGGILNAIGGRVELAAVAGTGTVGLNVDAQTLSLNIPEDLRQANVSIAENAQVVVIGGGGGSIVVNALNLELTNNSVFWAGIISELGTSSAQAGDIEINAKNRVSLDRSIIYNDLQETARGQGGNIKITADSLFLTNKAEVAASTYGRGNAGSVIINVKDIVSIDGPSGVFSTVESQAQGNSGNIYITTDSLSLTNGAQLSTSTLGQGNAGNVIIHANKNVSFDGEYGDGFRSAVFSQVRNNAIGNGGNIEITTGSLAVTNGALLVTDTNGKGNAGSVIINATDAVVFDGISKNGFSSRASSLVRDNAIGNGGNIEISTNSLAVNNGALLSTTTLGKGNAGNVMINANDTISFNGSKASSAVEETAAGNGGNITIKTDSLSVTNGAQLVVSTNGKGNAGSVIINATDTVSFDRSDALSSVFDNGIGKGGNIEITTGSLAVTNGSQFIAGTNGRGDAGSVIINANDTVSFDGSGTVSSVGEKGEGNSGSVKITTESLSVINGGQLSASTNGKGDAGSVIINAKDTVSFDGDGSVAFSNVEETGEGKGGNIEITTGSLFVTNSAQLNAWTRGKGDAGNVIINAKDTVSFDGVSRESPTFRSAAFSQVRENAIGKGGNIEVTTGSLFVTNGAQLQASTDGQGDAGNIKIHATDTVLFDGVGGNGQSFSRAFSQVRENAIGKGGNIDITTGSFFVTNGAQLSASTLGEGQAGSITVTGNTFEASNGGQLSTSTSDKFLAGNITLNIKDSINLAGNNSGLFANTTDGSIGNGGSIFIDPRILSIMDGAKIAVDSQGTGIGGNIELAAGFLTLDNGSISAETRSNTGGNITLKLQDLLLLRNGSQITTTAGNRQFGGDGGNITINAPFIVAVPKENSDITANAFTGTGGRVDITTNGIFGLAPQKSPTEKSDITASSESGVSGTVTINTPDVDPSRGLIQLPSNLVDVSQQITQGCIPRRGQNANRFIATGRGGLPLSPNEPLRGRAVITGWVDLPPQATAITDKLSTATVTKSTEQIVEAQGWIVDAKGDVILVAQYAQSSFIPSAMSCSQ